MSTDSSPHSKFASHSAGGTMSAADQFAGPTFSKLILPSVALHGIYSHHGGLSSIAGAAATGGGPGGHRLKSLITLTSEDDAGTVAAIMHDVGEQALLSAAEAEYKADKFASCHQCKTGKPMTA
jgi:hypothetical protein